MNYYDDPITVIQEWNLDYELGNVVDSIGKSREYKPYAKLMELNRAKRFLDLELDKLNALVKDNMTPEKTMELTEQVFEGLAEKQRSFEVTRICN